MSGMGHPKILNERRKNPHTIGQTAAGSKTSLFTGTDKELPLCSQVTYNREKVKQCMVYIK